MGRDPLTDLTEQLRLVYTAIWEERTCHIEQQLAVRSYIDAYTASHDTGPDDTPFDLDDAYKWISGGTDLEEFTIDHIEHLRAVRTLMPYPAWRGPTVGNLWLVGYASGD